MAPTLPPEHPLGPDRHPAGPLRLSPARDSRIRDRNRGPFGPGHLARTDSMLAACASILASEQFERERLTCAARDAIEFSLLGSWGIGAPSEVGFPADLTKARAARQPPVSVWEEKIARPLRALHLDSIRNKILVLALLATLIPTLATTLVSYWQIRPLLNDKIAQDLRGASSEAAREMAV